MKTTRLALPFQFLGHGRAPREYANIHVMQRLDAKVALISGGARGQGAAEARLFVSDGGRMAGHRDQGIASE